MTHLSPRSVRALSRRDPLSIDVARGIAVKRHVHEFVIAADARRFADAFHEVLTEPSARFGRIEVRRLPERAGQAFEVGERFHGCVSVAASFPRAHALLERLGLGDWVRRFEDAFTSDYSEIVDLLEEPDRFTAAYRYLTGSPIAGESRFSVEPCDEGCRLEVVFLYQEISPVAIYLLHKLGAALHDDVVLEQVRRAASRAGARIVWSTMTPGDEPETTRGARREAPARAAVQA